MSFIVPAKSLTIWLIWSKLRSHNCTEIYISELKYHYSWKYNVNFTLMLLKLQTATGRLRMTRRLFCFQFWMTEIKCSWTTKLRHNNSTLISNVDSGVMLLCTFEMRCITTNSQQLSLSCASNDGQLCGQLRRGRLPVRLQGVQLPQHPGRGRAHGGDRARRHHLLLLN